jgi:hypothetical protein
MPRRPPGVDDSPMSASDLWFLTGVSLAAITLLSLGMDLKAWPWIGMAAGFALGKGSSTSNG